MSTTALVILREFSRLPPMKEWTNANSECAPSSVSCVSVSPETTERIMVVVSTRWFQASNEEVVGKYGKTSQ
jgi:hypothetical protein